VQDQRKVDFLGAAEQVRHAFLAQVGQVFVAYLLGEDADDVVVVDGGRFPA
jgi:hypothetical protein